MGIDSASKLSPAQIRHEQERIAAARGLTLQEYVTSCRNDDISHGFPELKRKKPRK